MTKIALNKGCACWVALVVALLGACEIEDQGSAPTVPWEGDDVVGAADAGQIDAEPSCADGEVLWSMTVTGGRNRPPLEGVRVCPMDGPDSECGETDGEGRWAPCLPADADVALTFEKDGYVPLLYPIRTGNAPPDRLRHSDVRMTTNAQASTYWDQLDVEFPPTQQALVLVQVHEYDEDVSRFSNCLADVSVEASPEPALGPAYFDTTSYYDPEATATNVAACIALFAFDASVDATIELSHPTLRRCAHIDGGWVGDHGDSIRVPARAGFRTFVHAVCL